MQQNAILTFFKIVAFTVLSVMVFFTWWQQSKSEKVNQKIMDYTSQIKEDQARASAKERDRIEALAKLEGRLEANNELQTELIDLVREVLRSGVAVREASAPSNGGGTSTSGSSGTGGATKPKDPEPREVVRTTGTRAGVAPDGSRAPKYFSDAARKLWGSHPNYLIEEKDAIPLPDWNTPGLDPSGRIKRWWGPAPSDINPITSSDGVVTTHLQMYADEAIAKRHDLSPDKYAPAAAIRVEVNKPDFTEWIVFLRNDVKWHKPQLDLERYPHLKGEHLLTAHDFKFTMDMIKHPDVNCASLRNYYSECEGIEVVGKFCYIVRWAKPQYNSISFTLSQYLLPKFVVAHDEDGKAYTDEELPHAVNDHWFYRANKYLGCGPYYVAELDPSSHILLRRNEEYYGQLPAIREIYEEIFDAADLNLKKMEGKEFDITNLTAKQWDLKYNDEQKNPFNDGRIETNWIWLPRYAFIGWAQEHPIFKDIKVRRAMTMACDRPRLRDVIFLGKAKVVTGPQHPNSPFYPPGDPLPFDVEKAAAELKAAGWEDTDGDGTLDKVIDGKRTPFEFTAKIPTGGETFKALFAIFQEDLRKIGVKMTVEKLQWPQFVQDVIKGRNFECTALVWSGDGWQSDLYQIWHSSMADEVPSSNFIAFRDKQVDEWIEQARETFEHEDRIKIQHKLHKRLHELQPYTFLMAYQLAVVSWKDRVGNARPGTLYKTRPVWRLLPHFIHR